MTQLPQKLDSIPPAGGMSAYPEPPVAGYRVGPYSLCDEIAKGGMGAVYTARLMNDPRPDQLVAIKLLHSGLAADPQFVSMFQDEAEIASRIEHPNVCNTFGFGEWQGRHYLAMEYLIGESLEEVAERLEKSKLSPKRLAFRVARILADACLGLHAAHELKDDNGKPLNVVHRDITPSNLMLTYDGVTKVMDFGVLAAARRRSKTQTGIIKGKLAYVAPESLTVDCELDRRADVWGIGVIAWELLTGRRLFRRDDPNSTLKAVSDAEILPPSQLRSGLPKKLDRIVMRALERNRDERYDTALELARELTRFAATGFEVITPADLAALMDELFTGGRSARRAISSIGDTESPPTAALSLSEIEELEVAKKTALRKNEGASWRELLDLEELRERVQILSRNKTAQVIIALITGILLGMMFGSFSNKDATIVVDPTTETFLKDIAAETRALDRPRPVHVLQRDEEGRLILLIDPDAQE